jgi:hypothetical protein
MNAIIKNTKARTKGQRRKKGKISLPGGDVAIEPKGQGARQPQEDARLPMLKARARQRNIAPTKENLARMAAQRMGCEAGKAIDAAPMPEPAKAELFAAVQHIRKVWLAYDRAIGAPSRHAKVARILAPSDKMEATASSPALDMRDDATKQRQAVSAMMQVETWLGYSDAQSVQAVKLYCLDEPDVPVRNVGAFIIGLSCVADGIAGRKIVYRGV